MLKNITYIILVFITSAVVAQESDTSNVKVTRQWTLSKDFTEEVTVPVDTMFSLFNRFKATDKYSQFNAYPGNYGLPLYQINFFDRPTDQDMFPYKHYYPFMHLQDNALFLDTKVPFTELFWTFGRPRTAAEQTFRVRHSQNINRYFNAGIILDVVFSLGQYGYQLSDNKDFLFHSSYVRDRYKMYFSTGLNNLNAYENGGLVEGTDLAANTTIPELKNIVTNLGGLNKAKSILKNKNLLLVQRFTPGKKTTTSQDTGIIKGEAKTFRIAGTFSHILTLETNKRTYSDNSPLSGFYDTAFISTTLTHDSIFSRVLKNTIRFDFSTDESRKFRLGAGVGFRNELAAYSQIIPTHDTLYSDTINWGKSSNAILGKIYNNIGDKFRWVVTGDFYLTGFKAGDFNVEGDMTKSFDWKKGTSMFNIFGGITNSQPSFWYDQWGSNHFEWSNNFLKELRLNAGAGFSYPARMTSLKFNFAVINNYIDFGLDGLPSQYSKGISIASVAADKEFILWKFHFANNILLQKSSNTAVLDLPLVALKSAAFFEHNFFFKITNGNLNTQFGAEVFYNSEYYGYAYLPATGQYYRQNTKLTGNYPYINVFLNIKLKRTRFVLMLDHVNSGLMGYDYYLVPSYPMNIRMFKFGIAWTFYD